MAPHVEEVAESVGALCRRLDDSVLSVHVQLVVALRGGVERPVGRILRYRRDDADAARDRAAAARRRRRLDGCARSRRPARWNRMRSHRPCRLWRRMMRTPAGCLVRVGCPLVLGDRRQQLARHLCRPLRRSLSRPARRRVTRRRRRHHHPTAADPPRM